MVIYEKYIGKNRDEFSSYNDIKSNYKVSYPDNFNFAYDVIDCLGRERPNELALVWVGNDFSEKKFTFSEMSKYSNKTANYLKSLGIQKGDRVLVVLRRSYLFWHTILALHKLGAICVQATHLLMKKDYSYRCNAAKIKAVIITGDLDCAERFDEAEDECNTVKIKLTTKSENWEERSSKGWQLFEEGIESASEDFERVDTKATEISLLLFSSGTTGYPKMITHDYTYPLGHLTTGVFWHRVERGGLHFTISDTGWAKSLWGKIYGQWLGESAIFVYDFDKFDAKNILKLLEKYKITTFCAPPTMYRFILNEDVASYDLSSLKHCTTAGEALNPDVFIKWKELVGVSIYEGFGQTETTVCCGVLYPFSEPNPGAMGLPMPGYDIVVADENGEEVPAGISGEICIKAIRGGSRPTGLFIGYAENEQENQRAFNQGLYHTGDIVYRDERGYLWYVGRNDDIIKSSGYRIGPFEVESVLLEHPAVMEAAVTGVPDALRGFSVKATIVLAKGFEPSNELVKELQNYVKKNTAPYKYPRVVEFVHDLPKTTSGKIRRAEIRETDQNS
ncbi:MAG: AMP-binding protein [Clostridiales bacterium]|jgi:acetyl-CoA synthetase|nr:AMP-binding protein [Clostridiales bacterium]